MQGNSVKITSTHLFFNQHERGVAVLCGMPQIRHPGHQDGAIHTHLPLFQQHPFRLPNKRTRRNIRMARFPRLKKLPRLRKQTAQKPDTKAQTRPNPKNLLPTLTRASHPQIDTSDQDKPNRVPLLQNPTNNPTTLHRTILQRHGHRIPIHPTHKQPKQAANGEKLVPVAAIDAADLQNAQDKQVDDHRPLAPKPVAQQPETCCADGAEEQG